MTTVNIDKINWLFEIEQATSGRSFYRIGGYLFYAVVYNCIDGTKVSELFKKISPSDQSKRKELARGYLYWRYDQDPSEQRIRIHTASTANVDFKKNYFARLCKDLDSIFLKYVLPIINTEYFEAMMVGNTYLFTRCWRAIRELSDHDLEARVYHHLHTKKAGIKKAVFVASDEVLADWLKGDVKKPLFDADPLRVNHGDTEDEVLQDVTSRILAGDLPRIWTIMQKNWSDARLKGEASLGNAFLKGLCARKDKDSPDLCTLISKVERVVFEERYFHEEIDAICARFKAAVLVEFVTGNPFQTWREMK